MRTNILLLCLLLTACVGADPYSQIAAGQAALKATDIARQVAAEQTRGAMDAAEIEGTRYAGELLAIDAQIRGTQEAAAYQQTEIALQATRAVLDLQSTQARATAETIRLQSTAAYLVQYGAAMSTATAIVVNREVSATAVVRASNRANAIRWAGIVFLWGLVGSMILALVMIVHVLWLRGQAQAEILRSRAAFLAGPPADPPQLLPPDNGRREATDFLRQAATVVGSDAMILPRYELMGWSAERWKRVTDALQAAGALVKLSGKGSYIRMPYRNVGGLYQAVVSGKLALPPAPTGGTSQYYPPNGEQNANAAPIGGW